MNGGNGVNRGRGAQIDPAAGGKDAGVTLRAGSNASSPQAKTRLKTMPLPVLLGAMLLAGLCALLALNTASAAQELKQRSLTDANANASDQEQQLLRDLAAKQAPAALASAAAALGLVPNPNPAFLRINSNGSVTVLGSPVPASSPVIPAPPTPSSPPSSTPSKTPSKTASKTPTTSNTKAKPGTTPTRTSPKPTPHSTPTGGHR